MNTTYKVEQSDLIGAIADFPIESSREDEDKPKMVDIDKVKDWIFDTFYEDEHDGDYDYGQPYIVCTLDTMEQLLKNFEKTMGV